MPWWSWILIWAGLVLLLLGVIAAFAWMLFRKFLVMLAALGALAACTEVLARATSADRPQRAQPALLQDPHSVSERRELERDKRQARIDARRELRVMRGKLLLRADYRDFLHLIKRT